MPDYQDPFKDKSSSEWRAGQAAHLRLQEFHSNECQALLQRFEEVEMLIGSGHHRPTEGQYCEEILREYLRKILPSRYSVDTGFVRGRPIKINNKVLTASPQLDIIVHDTLDYAPLLRSGNLVIVLPDAV